MSPTGPIWARVVGQDEAVAVLRRAVGEARLAHAYAFVGPPGVGRRLTALGLAQAVLCPCGGCGLCGVCRRVALGQHPDCQLLAPTPPRDNPRGAATLKIADARELMHWAALAPLEGRLKVFILDDADRMTVPTAQALLKTLEEPPPRTLVILVLANPRALPPTVLSRCQVIRFRPLRVGDAAAFLAARGALPDAAGVLARLCRGQVGLVADADLGALSARRATALELLTVPAAELVLRLDTVAPDRAQVLACLETYWFWFRDALCLAAGGDEALVVNADRCHELRALARAWTLSELGEALSVIKDTWLALEGNLSPRLGLERVLLAVGARAA